MAHKKDGFIDYVGTHRQLETRCDEALEELVKGVVENGGTGKLTLTINVKAQGDGQLLYKAAVKTDVPRPGVPDSIFFGDEDGKLSRSDPRQMDIEDEVARERAKRDKLN